MLISEVEFKAKTDLALDTKDKDWFMELTEMYYHENRYILNLYCKSMCEDAAKINFYKNEFKKAINDGEKLPYNNWIKYYEEIVKTEKEIEPYHIGIVIEKVDINLLKG